MAHLRDVDIRGIEQWTIVIEGDSDDQYVALYGALPQTRFDTATEPATNWRPITLMEKQFSVSGGALNQFPVSWARELVE